MFIKPEISFIDSPIYFISSPTLTKSLNKYISDKTSSISLDASTLWELREQNFKKTYLLHFEWPGSDELFTIDIEHNLLESISESNNINTLGILIDYNIETNEARNAIFIQGIDKGLENIIPHLTNYKTQNFD